MDLQIALLLGQDGVTNGAVYALLALALVLVFAVTRVIFIPQGEFVAFGALIGVGLNSSSELSKQVHTAFELLNFCGGIITAGVALFALTSWQRQFRHSEKHEALRNYKRALDGGWAAEKLMDKLMGQIHSIKLSGDVYDPTKILQNIAEHQKDWEEQCRKVEMAWREIVLYFDQDELSVFTVTNRKVYEVVQSYFYKLLNVGGVGGYIEVSAILPEFTKEIRTMSDALNADTEKMFKRLVGNS